MEHIASMDAKEKGNKKAKKNPHHLKEHMRRVHNCKHLLGLTQDLKKAGGFSQRFYPLSSSPPLVLHEKKSWTRGKAHQEASLRDGPFPLPQN